MRIRILSLVLVILLLFTSMPIQALAEVVENSRQSEELFKEELRKAVDEKQYPNGLFEFLSTRMNTSENLSYVEFAIVRKGGTSGKASVTFKAIDVTAKYGKDYTISIPKGIFNQTLAANPDSKPLIESFENNEFTVGDSVYSAAYSTYPSSNIDYQVLQGVTQATEAEISGLRAARDSFTGTTSERQTWREVDQETKEAALKQHNEVYQGVPGVLYTFEFADGEYIKKLRFNTIDDTISEDEEQVLLALLDPVGGVLGESVSGFINIQDNDEKEKVEFEIVESRIETDRSQEYAEITVRRTAGLYRYGMIDVSTAALTAQPEVDYEPTAVELRFVPGQEMQKVKVPLLNGSTGNDLQFLIKLDPESPNLSTKGNSTCLVTIKSSNGRQLLQSNSEATSLSALESDLTAGMTAIVRIKSLKEDKDAIVTPKIWISPTTSTNLPSQYVGSMRTIGDSEFDLGQKPYPTIGFETDFDENFTDPSKVYLWGIKIERAGGLSGNRYYYVDSSILHLDELFKGTLTDSSGKKIPIKEVLLSGNTICVLPVYKVRTGFVMIYNDSTKGDFAPGTFKSGEPFSIGMMDKVSIRVNAKDGNSITGYKNADLRIYPHSFQSLIPVAEWQFPQFQLFNFHEADLLKVTPQHIKDYVKYYKPFEIAVNKPTARYYIPSFRPIEGLNINPSFPGEFDFTPNRNLSLLEVEYTPSSMKVMVDPKSNYKEKGSVAYFPEEGNYQTGDKDNPMIISPIQLNKAYTLSGLPEEGYRILWKDWSGDLNEDGILDENESAYIEKYENLFDRKSVNGDFFNYVTDHDKPLIYYSFEPKPTNTTKGTITGKVYLQGGKVLQNTETRAASTVKKPLADAIINVNGHTVSTDKDGKFLLESSDFTTNEYHTIVINYKGINYTGYVNVNAFTNIIIEEYSSFIPYNFSIANSKGKVDLASIDNRDANYEINFYANPVKPGLTAKKALIRIYSKEKVQRGEPIEVIGKNSAFTFTFNPATYNVAAGDTMAIQFVDQNGIEYAEHDIGFTFNRYLGTFSLLNSFKSPAKPAIDLIGSVDTALDLGLAGKVDKYIEKTSTEWTIRFGFSKDWEKSLSDGSKVDKDKPADEALKDAAKSTDQGVKDTTNKAIDKENKEKKSASVTSDLKFGISTSLYLKMTIDNDPTSKNYKEVYFNEMILAATVSGQYSKTVERMTPIGVTVYVELVLGGEFTAMLVIEQYDFKKFYFNGKGEIDFSNADRYNPDRDFTVYGKFILKPTIHVTAGAKIAGANLSISGEAKFNFDFTTSGSTSGHVTLTSEIKLEALFFTHKWKILEKTWSLYSKGVGSDNLFGDTSYLYSNAENYEIMSRDYLDNRGKWQENSPNLLTNLTGLEVTAENEQVLQTGIYPHPYTLLATLGENQHLLVFLDDSVSHNEKNRTHLFYSIYNGSSWSIPQRVDNDNTPDGLPWLLDLDDKVIVAWSSSASEIHDDDTVIEALNDRDIKGRFFDKATKTFGEIQNITYETVQDQYSDSEPHFAYWKEATGKENLMITYTKNDYRASLGGSGQDAVIGDLINPYYSTLAYRFYDFGKNAWDTGKDTGNGFYGQGFVSVSEYVYAEDSTFIITGDTPDSGSWSRLPNAGEVGIRELPGNDPLIADSNSAGYKDYAIMAYVLDLDTDLGTTADRELFIQLYSFTDKKFYTPIRITNDIVAEYDLEFVKVGDHVYLCYISGGDIMSLDMSKLIEEGLLQYEVSGRTVFLQNKLQGAYVKPEVAVYHSFDIKVDENGNEVVENDAPIDEFMVKANDSNLYIVWGESDVTYRDGIDPYSEEAVLPENHYREKHIYAARKVTGDTQWSYPVKLTNGKGANYNDLDFEILPDGDLRTVFIKSFSEVMDVAGKPMPVANPNNSILMTADFDVDTRNAEAEIEPLPMLNPLDSHLVEISVSNKSLSALVNAVVELYKYSGDSEEKVGEQIISLKGGEKAKAELLWQAPENLENVKLKAVVTVDDAILCSDEQSIIAKSVIDITDAYILYEDRYRISIAGTAKNNGNMNTNSARIMAEVNGMILSSKEQLSFEMNEAKDFILYADLQPGMFTRTVNEEDSVVETLDLTVHSDSGTGKHLLIERTAYKEDMDVVNNIKTFELLSKGGTLSQNVKLYNGSYMDIEPALTYNDEKILKPRLVYVSSNEEVADFGQGGIRLTAKKTGTTTITAYALPPINEIILSKNYFKRVENLLSLPEAAVKVKSFNVNVINASGSYVSTPIVNYEETKVTTEGNTTKITSEVSAVPDSTGKASVAIQDSVIKNAVKKALEVSENNGLTGDKYIEVKVTATKDVNAVESTISQASVKEILDSKIKALTVSTPLADIVINDKNLADIASGTGEDVKIKVSRVDASTLSEKVQQEVKEHPVYSFDISVGNKSIHEFKDDVTVSIPYTPGVDEDVNSIIIYYINDQNELEIVKDCKYDPETGMVRFRIRHFSKYAVGYNRIIFNDVPDSSWYAEAVAYIAARNITTGTGDGYFSPEDRLTRAQFLVMLMRAYDIEPVVNPADNFSDAGNSYYTGYLAAAKQLEISKGTGSDMFEPDNEISRQEMFTLLYNALKVLDKMPKVSGGKVLTEFSDLVLIAPWAKEAITLLAEAGVINGSNGEILPTTAVSRSEMAQILFNILSK